MGLLNNRKGGFTLIELLVVIAIIGVLSSIVLGSVSAARMKSRDAKRIADLHEIKSALELYYVDHGAYPVVGPSDSWNATYWAFSHCDASNVPCGWTYLQSVLAPYISSLPRDPVGPDAGVTNVRPWAAAGRYNYGYLSVDGGTYDLVAQFETQGYALGCTAKQYIFKQYLSGAIPTGLSAPGIWCGPWNGNLYSANQ